MKLLLQYIFLTLFCCMQFNLQAQDSTVLQPPVTAEPAPVQQPADTVITIPPLNRTAFIFPGLKNIQLSGSHFSQHPYFGFDAPPQRAAILPREWKGKELWFYSLVGVLFLFGLFRQGFEKYMQDIFRLFFRTTMKQRQIREQLMQTPLASGLLNLFFVLTASFYITFILQHFGTIGWDQFWLTWLYGVAFLTLVYLVKYLWLKAAGWLFNMDEAADNYIFIVFITNKVIGIFLLPVIVFLAFAKTELMEIVLVISWAGLGCLFVYRFILTFAAVRNQIKVNLFHFFLYLCAFEIAPLLLIYKALLLFFDRT